MASWKIHSQVQVAAYSEWNIAVPFSSRPKVMVGQNKFYFLKSYFGNIQKGKYAIKNFGINNYDLSEEYHVSLLLICLATFHKSPIL